MALEHLIHIVPRLPPMTDGIGDFSSRLARELAQHHQVANSFVVADTTWQGDGQYPVGSCHALSDHRPATALAALKQAGQGTVLLHYVGYGYQRRGIPFWLWQALRPWAKEGGRLVTFFHELWATGMPWSSVFYLRCLQRHIIRNIAKISLKTATSTLRMQRLLGEVGAPDCQIWPIASSIPGLPDRTADQVRWLAPFNCMVFGLTEPRRRAVAAHAALLRELERRNLLGKILVVGAGASAQDNPSADVESLYGLVSMNKVEVRGRLTPEAASQAFQECALLLSHYPASFACKSSTIMAALANGCVPILPDDQDSFPLEVSAQYLSCNGSKMAIERAVQQMASGRMLRLSVQGRKWYQENADWSILTRKVAATVLRAGGQA